MTKNQNYTTRQEQISVFLGISIQIISVVFAARFIIDLGARMLYSFIPQFSAGLGITVAAFGWLLFIRALAGVTSPVFGLLSDRYGRRTIMMASFLLLAACGVGMALSRQWWSVMPLILSGLAVAAFVPAQQAYISDRVTYEKRGRAMGSVEFAWSSSAIIALPLMGWMIEAYGWRTPFVFIALLSLCGAAIVWRYLPAASERQAHEPLTWRGIRKIVGKRNVMASMGVSFLLFAPP
ncbi:MAG: MFS transporter [Chloroflexota bacterium]|nr:MFS transporter [Chloroflexota bacterium]